MSDFKIKDNLTVDELLRSYAFAIGIDNPYERVHKGTVEIINQYLIEADIQGMQRAVDLIGLSSNPAEGLIAYPVLISDIAKLQSTLKKEDK